MLEEGEAISVAIAGWTYIVSFPYRKHNDEKLICSGSVRLAADTENEVTKKVYLDIERVKDKEQKSRYVIHEDQVNVSIFVEHDDFWRIFSEMKEQYKINECLMSIEFTGALEEGKVHEFDDFELQLAVDRG